MRSAVLALLLCTGQAIALPVNSPMTKGDTEVMKCIVEVISDTLSKPSPMPVSQECYETLQGDKRILSILRHQNLLKELQDLALQGAKERAHQQKRHSSFEDELSEALENQSHQSELEAVAGEASSKDTVQKRGDSEEAENREATEKDGSSVLQEPGQGSETEQDPQVPEEEEEAANTNPPTSLPGQEPQGPQAKGDSEGLRQELRDMERGRGAERGQQAERDEEEEAGEEAVTEEEAPTAALNPHPSPGDKETPRGGSQPEALAMDAAGKTKGKGEREHPQQEEDVAGAPRGPLRGGKSREQEEQEEEEEERLSKEWEDAKRWSKMEQLAQELTAEKRLEDEDEEDEPDRSLKRPFRTQAFGFGRPGPLLRRGWRPSSREDSSEAGRPLPGRGFLEEKKEEEGSANRRAEDQELESLSAIEAELEKVARQLQALQQG